MSTRGGICRQTGKDSFKGVYHHFDSYPDGLGQALWHVYHDAFQGDLPRMLRVLCDEHPAGWSTILGNATTGGCADFSMEPGYVEFQNPDADRLRARPMCYCHGDRSEDADGTVDETAATDIFIEFVYVFTEDARMRILGKDRGLVGWRELATVDLDGPEPDWEALPGLAWPDSEEGEP